MGEYMGGYPVGNQSSISGWKDSESGHWTGKWITSSPSPQEPDWRAKAFESHSTTHTPRWCSLTHVLNPAPTGSATPLPRSDSCPWILGNRGDPWVLTRHPLPGSPISPNFPPRTPISGQTEWYFRKITQQSKYTRRA